MTMRWNRRSVGITLLVLALSAVSLVPLLWLMGPHIRAERPPGIGPWWVAFGFAAQALFASRLIVQWLVAERERRSVIPSAFWWLSLLGGLMLLAYFWRRGDPVGTAGQLFGTIIYLRNIQLLARERREQAGAAGAAPAPAPTAAPATRPVSARTTLPPTMPVPGARGGLLPPPEPGRSSRRLPSRRGRPAPGPQSRQRQ